MKSLYKFILFCTQCGETIFANFFLYLNHTEPPSQIRSKKKFCSLFRKSCESFLSIVRFSKNKNKKKNGSN